MKILIMMMSLVSFYAGSFSTWAGTDKVSPETYNIGNIQKEFGIGYDDRKTVSCDGVLEGSLVELDDEIVERSRSLNLEYECSKVFFKYSFNQIQKASRKFDWGRNMYKPKEDALYLINLKILCDPRTYDEKITVSLMNSCEQEPREECFSEAVLSRISKLKRTEYFKRDRPKRCGRR